KQHGGRLAHRQVFVHGSRLPLSCGPRVRPLFREFLPVALAIRRPCQYNQNESICKIYILHGFHIDSAWSYVMKANLEYLRVFFCAAQCGSLTGAARKLMTSQPNVTRTLNRLEDQLQCRLL